MEISIHRWTIFLLMLTSWHVMASGKRILVVTPAPSYSHQIVFRALCRELNRVGHEIVTLTPNPAKDKTLQNYTEIDFNYVYKRIEDTDFSQTRWNLTSLGGLKTRLLQLGHIISDDVFKNPRMSELYAPGSGVHFDLVIAEMTMTPAVYALAHRFNAPLIGIMSMAMQSNHRYILGSPVMPSHMSNWELEEEAGLNLSFWMRLKHCVATWWNIYTWHRTFAERQQDVVKKYLGKDVPHVNELMRNMSLVLINQVPALSYARPELPNVVYFNGLHIQKKPPPLSDDLKEFLDDATNGFIYMSLGTNVRSHLLPKEKLEVFVQAFAKLPYRVVWKFEDPTLPVSENVFITPWVSQQAVLAHRNIKLFIYQGGLQSTEEAVHYGVPIVGIPFVYDQAFFIMRMVALGVGRQVNIIPITVENFLGAVVDVVLNHQYKRNMLQLRALTKDKPFDSLSHVTWWIEYVMRHKGAPYLQCSVAQEPWYQRYDLDVIAFLAVVTFIATLLAVAIIARYLSYVIMHYKWEPLKNAKKLD